MAEFQPRAFDYAHSYAIMDALKSCAQTRRSFIGAGYDFVEKPGEDEAFRDMIELAAQSGRDILYVDSRSIGRPDARLSEEPLSVAMHQMGVPVDVICEQLALRETEVYEAIASFKQAREQKKTDFTYSRSANSGDFSESPTSPIRAFTHPWVGQAERLACRERQPNAFLRAEAHTHFLWPNGRREQGDELFEMICC